jgi:hypothetical protein
VLHANGAAIRKGTEVGMARGWVCVSQSKEMQRDIHWALQIYTDILVLDAMLKYEFDLKLRLFLSGQLPNWHFGLHCLDRT